METIRPIEWGIQISREGREALNRTLFESPSGAPIEPHEIAFHGGISRLDAIKLQKVILERGLGRIEIWMYHPCFGPRREDSSPTDHRSPHEYPPDEPYICPSCGVELEDSLSIPTQTVLYVTHPLSLA